MNKYIGIGRITRDIELKYLPGGRTIAKTGFATSEKYKDKNTGEIKEVSMFIDIIVWGKSADIFAQYCQKGHRIAIEGKLQLDQWEDKDGKKQSKHVINVESFEFLELKSGGNKPKSKAAKNGIDINQKPDYVVSEINTQDDDDEIPF